jgi:hypothetical protein
VTKILTKHFDAEPKFHELETYRKRKVEYLAYRNELTQLQEEQRELQKRVRIKGAAKAPDDAAEFLKRLQSSVFFSDVTFENATLMQQPGPNAIKFVPFSRTAVVVF